MVSNRRPMKNFFLEFYGVNEDVEQEVRNKIFEIVDSYGLSDLVDPLYTCIKELLINAIKANYKNIFFEGYNPTSNNNSLPYDTALQVFKLEMTRIDAAYFEELALRNDMKATLELKAEGEVFSVEVVNYVEMTSKEQERVDRKLADAVECEDIADYFMKNSEALEDEGAGLGLVLITIILKSLGATSTDFSIKSQDGKTIAKFKIPLVQMDSSLQEE